MLEDKACAHIQNACPLEITCVRSCMHVCATISQQDADKSTDVGPHAIDVGADVGSKA